VKQIKTEFSPITIVYDASKTTGERWGIVNANDKEYGNAAILFESDYSAGSASCAVYQFEKIDIRGLNQEEKTLIINGATTQEPYFYQMQIRPGAVGNYVAAGAGCGMQITDLMTNTAIAATGDTYDEQLLSLYFSFLQPGFAGSRFNFEHISFGQTRQMAMTSTTGAWDSPEELTRQLIGSGAPNAGEFIYCIRFFFITYNGIAQQDDLRVFIPPSRFLIGGTTKEEAEYVRMMRLARQYEPHQRFDRD